MTPPSHDLERKPVPDCFDLVRHCQKLLVFWMVLFSPISAALAQRPADLSGDLRNLGPYESLHALRNWWIEAPGGHYGLMELTTHAVWSEPPGKLRHTSLLLGPWHWTFDASAPQILTPIILLVILSAFVTGWIRTKRYGL